MALATASYMLHLHAVSCHQAVVWLPAVPALLLAVKYIFAAAHEQYCSTDGHASLHIELKWVTLSASQLAAEL